MDLGEESGKEFLDSTTASHNCSAKDLWTWVQILAIPLPSYVIKGG